MTTAVAPWPNPVAYVRARFQSWWQARLPLKDSITLTQRNVYILPTRPGFTLAATLMVLLVGSINYQLNLGYLLTFLLAGSAVVGMHVCHGTLRGLTMNLIAPDPQFAGTSAVIGVNLLNDRKAVRYGIGLGALATQGEPYKHVIGCGRMCPRWAARRCTWHSSPSAGACTGCPPSRLKRDFRWAPFGSGRFGGPLRRCWFTPRQSRTHRRCRPASRVRAVRLQRKFMPRVSTTACAPTAGAIRSNWWSGRRPPRPMNWSAVMRSRRSASSCG
jgi:hypothetical protein